MRGFVRGDFKENTLRRIGKLSPSGNGLMMALHVVGGMASSGATLPIMAVGAAAKARADSSAMRGAEAVKDMVSGFRAPPQRPQLTGPASAAVTGAVPVLEDAASGLQNRLRLPR